MRKVRVPARQFFNIKTMVIMSSEFFSMLLRQFIQPSEHLRLINSLICSKEYNSSNKRITPANIFIERKKKQSLYIFALFLYIYIAIWFIGGRHLVPLFISSLKIKIGKDNLILTRKELVIFL